VDTTKHGLKQSLRLRDLVSIQIVVIVWLGWTGFAAKQGATQMVLWLVAILLFYLPLAAVVMKLSRALPIEGGIYQWIKEGVSPFAGYMAAWNLGIYSINAFAPIGSILVEGFARAAGPRGDWMLKSHTLALAVTAAACLVAYYFNVHGLQLAKWWSNAGSFCTIATFIAMACLLVKAFVIKAPLLHNSFSLAWPTFSILTLSIFAKVAVGALSGFDNAAVFAEECKNAENDVARSVMIAAPLIALMYVLGTSTVLTYVKPPDVDVSAAVGQVMQVGLGGSALSNVLAVAVVGAFNIAFVAAMVITIGVVARLPMVAGWDGLLPAWWSALHPKFRVPSKAIGAVAGSVFVLGVLTLLGADNQEAVQVGASAGVGSLSVMYMLLFSVVLFGFRSRPWRPGAGIRLGGLAGFSVALLALFFQAVPVGDVANTRIYALKVVTVMLVTNALGAYLYWLGARRQTSVAPASADAPTAD
jgi:glutamate:GABA antiporter